MDVIDAGLSFNAGAERDPRFSNTNIQREHTRVRRVSKATHCPAKRSHKRRRADHISTVRSEFSEGKSAAYMECQVGVADLSRSVLDQGGFTRVGDVDAPFFDYA